LATAQVLKGLMFNVGPRDPAPYTAVVVLLSLVALAATLIPARAAMRIDPGEALRCE
jgi:putative ABC transport system permease protein